MHTLKDVNNELARLVSSGPLSVGAIKDIFLLKCNRSDFYITKNGKILQDCDIVEEGCSMIRLVPRLVGGKGGFGSMLRAIGAQIEKTTNREACRDLSGRRLRDINEEKRLKNWIAQQAEREREATERRKKKLERLCFQPRHDFSDQEYEKARSELTEKVHDAVEQGFRSSASSSSVGIKRKHTVQGTSHPKKKAACLWVDVDEDELNSISSSDSDIEDNTTKANEKDTCGKKEQPKSEIQKCEGAENNIPNRVNAIDSNTSSLSDLEDQNKNEEALSSKNDSIQICT